MWRLNLEQARTPWWIRLGVPLAVWRHPAASRTLYLTFDDGPTPGVTEFVLYCFFGVLINPEFIVMQEECDCRYCYGHGYDKIKGNYLSFLFFQSHVGFIFLLLFLVLRIQIHFLIN